MRKVDPQRLAGWIMLGLGFLHVALFLAESAAKGSITSWLSADLYAIRAFAQDMPQAEAAFWVSLGSFAVPLILLGALVITLSRAGVGVPAYVGYGLGGWVLVCALILEPSGFPLGLIPAALLVRAASEPGTRVPEPGTRAAEAGTRAAEAGTRGLPRA